MKQPARITVNSRTSSIRNAFYASILPYHEMSREQELERLSVLGYQNVAVDNATCIYCGSQANTWDHLNAFIDDQLPSGYFHEINNVVPSCNTCNSSKGNKIYSEWLRGNSVRIKFIRKNLGVDTEVVIRRIEDAISETPPRNILAQIAPVLAQEIGLEYSVLLEKIFQVMTDATVLSNTLRANIEQQIENE